VFHFGPHFVVVVVVGGGGYDFHFVGLGSDFAADSGFVLASCSDLSSETDL